MKQKITFKRPRKSCTEKEWIAFENRNMNVFLVKVFKNH